MKKLLLFVLAIFMIGGFAKAQDTYTLTVISNNPFMGSVYGGGVYPADTLVEIGAIPATYARFVQWDDGETNNPRKVLVDQDLGFKAIFDVALEYTIEVVSDNSVMGGVTGSGTYKEGSNIEISAIPNDGYVFVRWNDDNTDNPRNIVVTGDATYTAYFEEVVVVMYTLELYCDSVQGTVTGAGIYEQNTVLTIQAIPNQGYTFVKWSDDFTDNPRIIVMKEDISLEAIFNGTGVDEYNINTISLYPNPASEKIYINGVKDNSKVEIYNMSGELVKVSYTGDNGVIGVDGLATGLYIVRCDNVVMRFTKE